MMNKNFYAEFMNTNIPLEQLHRAYDRMSEQRRSRCDKMRLEGDKRACICADMLIRKLAEEHLGTPPEKVVLCADEKGKPYIKGADCHISISHKDNWVLCALSPHPIGIDIEKISNVPQMIADRLGKGFDGDEQFYRYWTAAESYGKLTGEGVWWALKQDFFGDKSCRFESIPCPEGYVATICVKEQKN